MPLSLIILILSTLFWQGQMMMPSIFLPMAAMMARRSNSSSSSVFWMKRSKSLSLSFASTSRTRMANRGSEMSGMITETVFVRPDRSDAARALRM